MHTHLTAYVGLQARAVIERVNLPFIWTIHGLYRSRGELEGTGWTDALYLIKQAEKAVITAVSQDALIDVFKGIEISAHKMRVI